MRLTDRARLKVYIKLRLVCMPRGSLLNKWSQRSMRERPASTRTRCQTAFALLPEEPRHLRRRRRPSFVVQALECLSKNRCAACCQVPEGRLVGANWCRHRGQPSAGFDRWKKHTISYIRTALREGTLRGQRNQHAVLSFGRNLRPNLQVTSQETRDEADGPICSEEKTRQIPCGSVFQI